MRRLGPSDRFMQPVQILDGPRVQGTIQTISEGRQPGFEYAYETTLLRVHRESLVRTGQVIELPSTGLLYLVADHDIRPTYRTHRLLRADRQVTWTRKGVTTHPLTGEEISSNAAPTEMGRIWVLWNMIRREAPDFVLHTAEEKNFVATGEDVQLQDMLDGQEVKRVNTALGLKVLQVQ